jgi:hypothetical protein
MKKLALILALALSTLAVFAQEDENYIISFHETKLGAYLGIGGRYSTSLDSDPAGFLDFRGAVVFNGSWAVGLTGSGLYYDKKLSRLVNDGTYHLHISYGAVFVEKIFSLNEDFKISLSIATGSGEAYYEYDKDYHKEKIWTEETIDKTTFAIFEPGIEIQHRISGNWWIGINGTYRNTSPLTLIGTDENLLRKFSGGLTFKWGIF